jgi:hypothetical protein
LRLLALILLAGLCGGASAQSKTESRELIGKLGTRSALLILNSAQRPDGSWQVAGEYVILATLTRRFVEGERSPELGVTVLREGTTPILFGRAPIAELRGVWREGSYKGTRHGPAGQAREEFEFSEEFPSMEGYSARVRCEAKEGRYQAKLAFAVANGKLRQFDWRATEPGGSCSVVASGQEPMRGGLRLVADGCRVTLRDVGDFVALSADNCGAQCLGDLHLAPLLIDRRGNCELLRHGAR